MQAGNNSFRPTFFAVKFATRMPLRRGGLQECRYKNVAPTELKGNKFIVLQECRYKIVDPTSLDTVFAGSMPPPRRIENKCIMVLLS